MLNLNPIVFVVDPDPSVRKSLQDLIHRSDWKCETFGTAAELLARPRYPGVGCLLLEATLPDVDSFEFLARTAVLRREMPVIVIAHEGSIPLTVRAMKAGATEFLLKPFPDDVAMTAIRYALERSRAVLQQQSNLLELRMRYDTLSGREREVMDRVVDGLLNKQVGAVLGISEITVKAHRGKVMRKMHAGSLADLVRMANRLTPGLEMAAIA